MWEYRFVTFAPVECRRLRGVLNRALYADGSATGPVLRTETQLMLGMMQSSVELEPVQCGTRVRIQIVLRGMLGIVWSRIKGEREGRRIVAQVQLAIELARSDNSGTVHREALVV